MRMSSSCCHLDFLCFFLTLPGKIQRSRRSRLSIAGQSSLVYSPPPPSFSLTPSFLLNVVYTCYLKSKSVIPYPFPPSVTLLTPVFRFFIIFLYAFPSWPATCASVETPKEDWNFPFPVSFPCSPPLGYPPTSREKQFLARPCPR